ncbi:MAG: tRNA preQ1(34) S-adenosylmethionine ribosyltransferase-isomerase QueA [Methanosarcinales archaeon]|nr:tRNA preQ1(34) S-adenosylmethionine ribosyltransferase-isomerase QueA [Methanosarcinales archaeon]
MRLSDFDYHLPKHMIAQQPAYPRDSSGLMIIDKHTIYHRSFHELPEFLRFGDLIIANESRVIPARLRGNKDTGGKVEVLLVKQQKENNYECLIKGRVKNGQTIHFNHEITCTIRERVDTNTGYRYNIRFNCEDTLKSHLHEIGIMPVPPYIKEPIKNSTQYQTVYSSQEGSIAAPTAGLHFTDTLLNTIKSVGVGLAFIILHVGVGTFMPVRVEMVEDHVMEPEYYIINKAAADAINNVIASGGRLIVVGTTTVRALESACWQDGMIQPSEGWSEKFIYPPYKFKTPIGALITNFHLPKSTLLMLVSAYAGRQIMLDAYQKAIDKGYRFYSFGDAMLIMNREEEIHV